MSSAKFAPITSSLLARKGEAHPWNPDSEKQPLAWRSEPVALAAPPPRPPAKDKSCSVRMSPHDYERLGILAVKAGTSRQQLLKQALADFLAARARQLSCACLEPCDKACC